MTHRAERPRSVPTWTFWPRHLPERLSLLYMAALVIVALAGPHLSPYLPEEQSLSEVWAAPGARHVLGTDGLGRDVLSRLLLGTRLSLSIAAAAALLAAVIGVPLGMVSGYVGGWIEGLVMRVVDLLYAFPTLVLVILLAAILRSNLASAGSVTILREIDSSLNGALGILLALSLTAWLPTCRLVRSRVTAVRHAEFVLAARSIGGTDLRILRTHILPHMTGTILATTILVIPSAVVSEAGLTFLGVGVNPPAPSWGQMIAEGAQAIRAHPHLLIASTATLTLTVWLTSLLAAWAMTLSASGATGTWFTLPASARRRS